MVLLEGSNYIFIRLFLYTRVFIIDCIIRYGSKSSSLFFALSFFGRNCFMLNIIIFRQFQETLLGLIMFLESKKSSFSRRRIIYRYWLPDVNELINLRFKDATIG